MVVRLEGNINGQDVIFQKKSGDEWEAIIPKSVSGTYVVSLTAYDESGNIGRAFKYLVCIDWISLCVKVEKLPYQAYVDMSEYEPGNIKLSDYIACLLE